MAPLVAIALRDIPVRKVHKPQNVTSSRDSHTPAIPTILQIHKFKMKYLSFFSPSHIQNNRSKSLKKK